MGKCRRSVKSTNADQLCTILKRLNLFKKQTQNKSNLNKIQEPLKWGKCANAECWLGQYVMAIST
ncbi:hypothetical protein BLOT_013603 [Blomia tropicalis]|nr:hypothetical protein BLOT_013603 [Blomia tropicalis]